MFILIAIQYSNYMYLNTINQVECQAKSCPANNWRAQHTAVSTNLVSQSKLDQPQPTDDSNIQIPMERLLGYQLKRASQAMEAKLSASYRDLGFRLLEATVLLTIEANPGIKQSQIGAVLNIKSANMTPMVTLLENNNCVERKRLDGRSQGLFLTDHGKSMAQALWQCVDENERWLSSRLPDIDTAAVIPSLEKIWR